MSLARQETAPGDDTPSLVRFDDVAKSFGPVQALAGATLAIEPGECLGLVGHNGAGKSTLIHLLNGTLAPTGGSVSIQGATPSAPHSARQARQLGIRCVFQELSLAPNLTVAENTRVMHRTLRGPFWRRRAGRLIADSLDRIFPDHAIRSDAIASDLTLTERQMVEIARAFTVTDIAPRLVILDEPTSSLDRHTSSQLLAHVRREVACGLSVLFVSHMLGEVIESCDRVAVMSDGRVVAIRATDGLTRDDLVESMGGHLGAGATGRGPARIADDAEVAVSGRILSAHVGEIVGLGGLAGHGQTECLVALFDPATMAFVAGDRQRDGVFPLWSIAENISVGALRAHRGRRGLLDPRREMATASEWGRNLRIRAPHLEAPLVSLSGGNQQKALFARALASPARVILMDDPMRGVDIATRQDVYALIREQAERGRTFFWYTTDADELLECDRVLVFREREIVAELAHHEIDETRLLQASF